MSSVTSIWLSAETTASPAGRSAAATESTVRSTMRPVSAAIVCSTAIVILPRLFRSLGDIGAQCVDLGEVLLRGFELDAKALGQHRHRLITAGEKHQLHQLLLAVAFAERRPGRVAHALVAPQVLGGSDQHQVEVSQGVAPSF